MGGTLLKGYEDGFGILNSTSSFYETVAIATRGCSVYATTAFTMRCRVLRLNWINQSHYAVRKGPATCLK